MHLRTLQKTLALGLLVVIGLIHLISAPDQFNDATYKGVLFLLNVGGALLAVAGICRAEQWGWILGLIVASGALLGYIISRAVGLPGLPVDPAWLEPLGLLSLVVEALFIALAVTALPVRSAVADQRRRVVSL